MKNGTSVIVTAIAAIVAGLKDGERVAVLLRHGSRMEHKNLPNDSICAESWDEISKLGAAIRKAGIKLARIFTSPRGRSVMAACALGEGNAEKEESIAPFRTDEALTDGSNDIERGGPAIVKKCKAISGERGITGEQALLLSNDDAVSKYAWQRAAEYGRSISTHVKMGKGEPLAFVTHGGLMDISILQLLHPKATRLDQLGTPEKWLEMGAAAIVVFSAEGDVVKVVYL